MAITHAQPGQLIALHPDPNVTGTSLTKTLFKTPRVEVIRLVLPQGKTIAEHRAPGELIVQGLTGRAQFSVFGTSIEIESGQMFYLPAAEPHAVTALEDCSFLLTILLAPRPESGDSPIP